MKKTDATSPNTQAASQAALEAALGLEALEPRLLLDAAAVATGAEAIDLATTSDDPLVAQTRALFSSDVASMTATAAPAADPKADIVPIYEPNGDADEAVVIALGKAPITPVPETVDTATGHHPKAEAALVPEPKSDADTARVGAEPLADGTAVLPPLLNTGTAAVDFNGAESGRDADTRLQPTTGNVFAIFPADLSIESATGTLNSVSFTIAGAADGASELLYHSGPAGATLFWLDGATQTVVVSLDAGGTQQVEITRNGTDFTITGVGGTAVSASDVALFLSQTLYGDLAPGFTEGPRDFTFVATEAGVAGDASVLTVRVHNFPVAADQAGTVMADATAPATGNVLTGTTDATPGDSFTVADVDGYAASVGQAYTTTYGTIVINTDGTYSYTVDTENPTVTGLRGGASLQDVIAFGVADAAGNVDTGFLVITVNGVDDPPVATDNRNDVRPVEAPTATGNVIYDDDGQSTDVGDRPLSQLIWESEFADGQSVDGATVTVNGVDVTLSTSDPANVAGASNHVVSFGQNGGHDGYLVFTMGGTADPANTAHTLSMDFSEPVTNLSFTLADIDWSQGTAWQDQFTVYGYLDGELVPLTAQVAGTVVSPADGQFYGTGSVPASEAHGNVSIRFDSPVDRVVIAYNYGPDATARDGFQVGALSDLAWQGTGVPRVSAINGSTAAVGSAVAGTYGTFTVNGDGSYTYTVDESHPDVASLAPGATLVDSVWYTLIDSFDASGNTDSALLSIVVTGPADNDLDGVPDSVDIDDDNDGISDLVEGSATSRLLTADVITNSLTHPEDDAALFDADAGNDGHLHPGDFAEFRVSETVRAGDSLAFQGGAGNFDIYVRLNPTDPWVLLGSDVAVPSSLPVTMDFNDIRIEANYGDHVEFSGVIVQYATAQERDTDGDGVPDHLDLDSDNDGISDLEESGSGGLDANGDGVLDGMSDPAANDLDDDGLLDSLDNGNEVTPRVSDADSLADYRDLDSDGDGIPDAIEARPTATGGLITSNADSDGDGVLDVFDTVAGFGGSFDTPHTTALDTADTAPDYIDTDSDGDGITDAEESGLGGLPGNVTYLDADGTLDPVADLLNVSGDPAEVAYREINLAVTLDLDDNGTTATRDVAATVTANGTVSVLPIAADAAVLDPDSPAVSALVLGFDLASFPNIGSEALVIGGAVIPLDPATATGTVDTVINVGGNSYTVRATYGGASGVEILILQTPLQGDGLLPTADAEAILRTLEYRNTASGELTPDERRFTVQALADQPGAGLDSNVATVSITVVDPAPLVDLNGPDAGLDASVSYAENSGAVAVFPAASSVIDGANNITALSIAIGGATDAGDEVLNVGGVAFTLGADDSDTSLTVGGVPVTVEMVGGTLSIVATDGVSTLDAAALQSLLRGITYAHASDAPTPGVRTLSVSALDANGNATAQPAVLSVDVQSIPDAPLAQDDVVSTAEDAAVTVDVLTNDSDADGDPLTVTAVTQGANGTVVIDAVTGNPVYTPDADFNGTDTFTYTVSDGQGGTDTATVTVTVDPVNDVPAAEDDAVSTPEDTAVMVDVRGNDTDADGDTLTVTAVTQGANGSVSIDPVTGNPVYTPDADFNGTDSFTYTVEDGQGGTDTATVTVTVSAVNDLPTAEDDSVSTPEDTAVEVSVRGNDADADGDALTVTAVTQGTNGTVTLDPITGNPVYTPDADFHGTDSFTYTVSDGAGGTDTATVTVTIDPVNDTPVAVDDAVSTPEDTAVMVGVRGNDADADGDTLMVTAVTQGANGTVTLDPVTGNPVYTPNADFNGTDTFTYTVSDGAGGTATAVVTVSVASVNDTPVAVDDAAVVAEDGVLSVDVLDNDSDADGDALVVIAVTQGTNGTVAIDPETGQPVYTPDADFNGTDSFTYTVSDGQGGADTAVVTVSVTPANDAPVMVLALSDLAASDSDAVGPLDLSGGFGDVDGDALSYSATGLPAGLSLDPVTGVLSGTLNADASQGGPAGDGVYSVTITATDPDGTSVSQTVTYTVANPAPVAADDAVSTAEDTAVTVDVRANDTDADGDALTVTAVTQGANGSVAIDAATGDTVYTPDADFNGTDSFTYTVSDGQGGTSTAIVSVTVTAVNDAPVASDDTASTAEDTAIAISVRGNDADADGDALMVTAVTQGSNGTVAIDPVTGQPVYTPDADFHGTDTFTYTVSDGAGGTDTATVTIVVDPVNDVPVAADDAVSTAEDTPVSIDVRGNDADADGDPLVVTAVTQGANGTVAIDPVTGQPVYTPDADFHGTDAFTYTISDGQGGTDTAVVVVSVASVNDAPVVASALPAQSGADGAAIAPLDVSFGFSDVDGDTLSYSATGLPPGVVLDPLTGVLSGTLTADASQGGAAGDGVYIIEITATDPDGQNVMQTVAFTVGNPAPVVGTPIGPQTALDSADISIQPTMSDPDGDVLSYSASGLPNGLSIDPATGEITGTLDRDASQVSGGSYMITVTATDGQGGSVTDSFTLTVTNPVPLLGDDAVSTAEDTPVTVDVRINDIDPDGDALSVTAVTQGANGSVSIDPATGNPVYTPDTDFHGTDSFTYTVSDADGATVTARVAVTVSSVNDTPVASDDSVSVGEDGAVNIDALINDSDADGDPLTVTAVTQGANGTVAIDPVTGQPVYTPDADFHGTDTFTYTVSDGQGGTDTATVTVTVNPVNDVPVEVAAIAAQQGQDGALFGPLDVSSAFADVDGDALSYSAVSLPSGLTIDSVTGVVSGTPSADASQGGPASDGIYSATITATDPDGASVSQTVEFRITNPAPEASDDAVSVDEDNPVTVDVRGNDADPDGDALTVTAVTQGANGSVSIDPVTGNPVYTPDADFNGTDTFTYTISDGQGGTSTASVTVSVDPVNDAPDAAVTELSVSVVDAGAVGPVEGGALFADRDGDTLAFTSPDLPAWLTLDPVTGTLIGTAPADLSVSGPITITLIATDDSGATAEIPVVIDATNPAPVVLDPVADQRAVDGQVVTLDASANDPDGDALHYTASGLPAGLAIDRDTGLVSGTLASSASQGGPLGNGVYLITVNVSDEQGGTVEQSFTLDVSNPAPTAVDDSATVGENGRVSVNVIAGSDSDPDGDALSTLPFDDRPGSQGGTFTLGPDGVLAFDTGDSFDHLDEGESVTTMVSYTLVDADGATSMAVVAITVTGGNDAPVVTGPFAAQTSTDAAPLQPYDVSALFTDVDVEPLAYSLSGAPDWLRIDAAGVITGTPPSDASQGGEAGTYAVNVTATDPDGQSVTQTLVYTVVNTAVTAADDAFTTPEDTPVAGQLVLGSDSDADGDALRVSGVRLADGRELTVGEPAVLDEGTLTVRADGSFDFDPAPDFNGNVVFDYTVTDDQGSVDTARATVVVSPVADDPRAQDPQTGQPDPGPIAVAVADGAAVSDIDAAAYFAEVDGETIQYTLEGAPDWLRIDPDTGTVSGTAPADASLGGPVTVTVVATDDSGAQARITLVVDPVNTVPEARDDGVITVGEDGSVIIDPLGNDGDADGDALRITAINGQPVRPGDEIAVEGGTLTVLADGTLRFDPRPDWSGTPRFTYTVSDGEGGTSQASVALDVVAVPDAPVLDLDVAVQTDHNDAPIRPVAPGTLVSDVDSDAMQSVALRLSGPQDGPGERVTIAGVNVSEPADSVVTVGGTEFRIVSDGKTVTITPVGSDAPIGDVDALLATLEYAHQADRYTPGERRIDVTVSDPTGLESNTGSVVVAVMPDTTAPDRPDDVVLQPNADGTLGVIGTTEPGASVVITFEDGTQVEVTAGTDGAFSATSECPQTTGDVRVVATDASGNSSAPAVLPYVDVLAPEVPVISPDAGVSTDDLGRVVVQGTGEKGTAVRITLPDGTVVDTVVGPDGQWSALSEGPQPDGLVRVTLQDAAGNVSGAAEAPYVSPLLDRPIYAELREHGMPREFDHPWREPQKVEAAKLSPLEALPIFRGGTSMVGVPGTDGAEHVWVEAVAHDHGVQIHLGATTTGERTVRAWEVRQANGAPLPAGVELLGDVVVAQPDLGADRLHLRVRALLENGQAVGQSVTVDLRTGAVSADGTAALGSQTLSEQMAEVLRQADIADGVSLLGAAQ